jgi:hypothetical protein
MFQSYAFIMPIGKSCTKFHNKLNCLQRYNIAQNYTILHRVVQHLFQQNIKVSHYHHI